MDTLFQLFVNIIIFDGTTFRGLGPEVKIIQVDGNDRLADFAATQKAGEIAMSENCLRLIKAMIYHCVDHLTSDDLSGYRSKSQEKWQVKDPVIK